VLSQCIVGYCKPTKWEQLGAAKGIHGKSSQEEKCSVAQRAPNYKKGIYSKIQQAQQNIGA